MVQRSPLVRLYHMNTPHRPTEADFRSTVPISRTGMQLFSGLGCSVSCSKTSHVPIPKSDVELTVIGTARHHWWSWSQFSRSSHCERPAEDASSCAMARAGLTAPRTSMSCRLLRTSSRLSVLFLEHVGQRGEWRTVFCALRCCCWAACAPRARRDWPSPRLAYAALRTSACCSTPPPRSYQRPHGHV